MNTINLTLARWTPLQWAIVLVAGLLIAITTPMAFRAQLENNIRYATPFSDSVRNADTSDRAPGFMRESDVKKLQGHLYQTY